MLTKIDKAVAAFIVAAAGVLAAGSANGVGLDSTIIISALVVGIVAGLGVWATPNKPS